jgi:hypothetical protein
LYYQGWNLFRIRKKSFFILNIYLTKETLKDRDKKNYNI